MPETALMTHQLKHVKDSPGQKAIVHTITKQSQSAVPKHSVTEKVDTIINSNRLETVDCLIPANYFLFKPIIEKSLYISMMTQVCDWNVTFSTFHNCF